MKNMLRLSSEELKLWKDNITTEKVKNIILENRSRYCELLISGSTIGDDTIQQTAKIVGIIYGLDLALNIEIEEDDSSE